MLVNDKHLTTIWYEKKTDKVKIIDQRLIPFELNIIELNTLDEVINEDFIFVCLPTPMRSGGKCDLSILDDFFESLPDPNFAPLFVNGSLYNSDSKYFCILGSCLKLLKKSEIRGYLSKAKTLFLSAFSTKL